ncbi:hypothetical protein [Streptomyces violascens]|uniref:Uncharacterized protein n=1 Tax=Streptomyces violascens TaxID=67381 RepID=A0ABQ3QSG6_9ACTN|nr:hypothetical protein [Streptomyces violascens]GGU32937.1 hypothetical protein GCM10010289_62700 [Streptomyces violascens]GHI40211.1 hypothetical protein Sviol_46190 [Streptomyces violascens]
MSRRILRPTRAQVAEVLAASVLAVSLLAPSASADPPPPGPKVSSSSVIDRVCREANAEPDDGPALSCERDLAPRLSHLIGPGSGVTCRNQSPNDIVCRREG